MGWGWGRREWGRLEWGCIFVPVQLSTLNLIRDLETHNYDISSFDFTKADWANLSAYFDNIDHFNLFENCIDSESMVNAFYNVIYTGLNQFVPVRKSHTSSNHSKIIYPHRIRKLLNKKCRLWSIYRRLRTPESLNKYKLNVVWP